MVVIAVFALVLILGRFSPTQAFERDVYPNLEDKANFIAGTVILQKCALEHVIISLVLIVLLMCERCTGCVSYYIQVIWNDIRWRR